MQRTTWLSAFVLAAGACLAVWALGAWSDRSGVLRAAEANLAATARLLEQHADRALEAADRAVQAAAEAAGDLSLLEVPDGPARLHERLAAVVRGSPQLASAWVLDHQGRLIADSMRFPMPMLGSFAHRDYFQVHLGGERGLAIGELAAGTELRHPRFTVSRPLLTSEGELAGVAVAGVFAAYFGAVYAEAGLGAGAQFAMFRRDGAPLAIWPGDAPAPAWPELVPGPASGSVRIAHDGLLGGRIVAMRHLSRFPVLLVVSKPVGVTLADWQRRTLRSGAVTAALLAGLAGLTVIGLRGARYQRALTFALQRERGALERRVAERTAHLAESEARFREMADNAPVMIWVTDAAGACTFLSRSWYAFTGQQPRSALGRGWLEAVHPEDRPRFAQLIDTVHVRASDLRVEFRLRYDGDASWHWALAVAAPRPGPQGAFLGCIGSIIDITDRREAEERQELMARELDHRAKNALTVVQAALRLTPRDDAAGYAAAVEGRVAALARAHAALAARHWQGVALRTLLEGELAVFLPAAGAPQATLDGPDLLLVPASVQALSMAFHELATNAVKHGALSVAEGRLTVRWRLDHEAGALRLSWEERGGPPAPATPARQGFGSRVIEATIKRQLGGRYDRWVGEAGLRLDAVLPLERLTGAPAPSAAPADQAELALMER